jgi:hypothetical protein
VSFDVFLQRFVAGGPAGDELGDAVSAVLERHGASGSEAKGYEVAVEGGAIHFWAHASHCAFFLHGGMAGELAELMFDLATAGDMVILPASIDPATTILVRPEQARELPPEIGRRESLVRCRSAEDVRVILTAGHVGWARYRDHVLRGRSE